MLLLSYTCLSVRENGSRLEENKDLRSKDLIYVYTGFIDRESYLSRSIRFKIYHLDHYPEKYPSRGNSPKLSHFLLLLDCFPNSD